MNLGKKCPLQKQKFFEGIKKILFDFKVSIHQKSLPPKSKKNDSHNIKSEKNLPAKFERLQRDIFGATILPQNLSYENSKKLTTKEVKLEDIPIVDENAVAEVIMAGRLKQEQQNKNKRSKVVKKRNIEEGPGIMVIHADLTRRESSMKAPPGELFCEMHPFDEIPGPKIFRAFLNAMKNFTRQLTVASLFRFFKKNTSGIFRVYGPIVRLPDILGGKIVLISRPEDISAIFRQDPRYPVNSALDSIQLARSLQCKKNEPNDSNEEWENLKNSICDPPIKESEKYFEEIDEASNKFLRRIKMIRNGQDEVPDNFLFEINKWSLECLCQVIFDKPFGFLECESDYSSESSQLLQTLSVATKNLRTLESGFQFWRLINTYSLSSLSSACRILEDIISENVTQIQLDMIRRHVSGETNSRKFSLLEGVLLQNDSTPDDVMNSILDLLLIGTNTMSAAFGFLLYHLSRNPRCQAELWKEIKTILPEKYSRLEYDQLGSLKYLQACLKESLRLKMPMPILSRVLSNNVILDNYQIPKGTFILMAGQVESVKEENFSEPTKFLPERWINQNNDYPLTLLPVRNYFERRVESLLAEVSIWVCVSHVFRHYLVEYCHEEIQVTNTTISFPNKPLRLTFTERKD